MLAHLVEVPGMQYPDDGEDVIVFDRVGDHNFFGCITKEGRIIEVDNLRLRIICPAPDQWTLLDKGLLVDDTTGKAVWWWNQR